MKMIKNYVIFVCFYNYWRNFMNDFALVEIRVKGECFPLDKDLNGINIITERGFITLIKKEGSYYIKEFNLIDMKANVKIYDAILNKND